MDTESSIKAFLDSLSQLPGSVLYRGDNEWKALPPGSDGQILALDTALLPVWINPRPYRPGMIQFNGTNSRYTRTGLTLAGNSWTFVCTASSPNLTAIRDIIQVDNGTVLAFRVQAQTDHRLRIRAHDNTNTLCLHARSNVIVDDGNNHSIFIKYTSNPASLQVVIDGQDAEETTWPSRVLLTKTLPTGAGYNVSIGSQTASTNFWAGRIGYLGFKQSSAPVWTSFQESNGQPKSLNHATWAEWSGAPPLWHESGKADENRGSVGAFTRVGTPLLADAALWS